MRQVRTARIKISPAEGEAVYHCISRTVNGDWLFDDVAKEVLRRQLWQVADYCGVQIGTYAILSNHFHVLVRVPRSEPTSDRELLRRYRRLYPSPTPYQTTRLNVIEAELRTNGAEAQAWRRRQLALMGDVSQFMKLVKQRFSIWYNKTHQRFGTLWAERFKSVLVEVAAHALSATAAYIDLNGVRAGLVMDPKDYRFCGYAEAVAGSECARSGIQFVVETAGWSAAQASYRELIYGIGGEPRENAMVFSAADVTRIIGEGGRLSPASVLRCRIRYFSDGLVLGGRVFVETQRHIRAAKRGPTSFVLPLCIDWGELAIFRKPRGSVIG